MRGGDWGRAALEALSAHDVAFACTVPDAGLIPLLREIEAGPTPRLVTLANEAEGVGLAVGAWLGGKRSILLMQSSGVGNVVNHLGLAAVTKGPLLMLVSMRGEAGEGNPWQVPMGRAVPAVLAAAGVEVLRARTADEIAPLLGHAARRAFTASSRVAVLISQSVIGAKSFERPR